MKQIWLMLIALFLFVPIVDAAHTYDTKAQYQTTSWSTVNPGNLSFTAGSGASVMVLTIFTAGTSYRTAGTPTFNGKYFTSLGRNMYTSSPEGSSEMWYLLLTPADTGSAYTVSVPNAATSRPISFHVSTFKSATGVSALDVNASKNASAANPSQSVITTANGDVIVAGMFNGLNTAPSVTSPGIAIFLSDENTHMGMSQYYLQSNAGQQALGWTGNQADYSMQTAAFKEMNPIPTTTSISPTGKIVGDAGFTMTVTGTNFVSGSNVRFDGSDRTTTYVSSTSLNATIPASDLTTAGTFNITVFNPAPGGGTSNAQTFTVNAPTYTHTIAPSSPQEYDTVYDNVSSTSSSGAYMEFNWTRPPPNSSIARTATQPRDINYTDSFKVDLKGDWTINVIEKNSSLVQLGTGSTTFYVKQFPEFGKLGAVLPLFAIGILYMSLRKRYL